MALEFPDAKTQVESIVELVESNIITLDEARATLGFPPMPNDIGNNTLAVYLGLMEATVFEISDDLDDDELDRIQLN
jgi:hypothetical protein